MKHAFLYLLILCTPVMLSAQSGAEKRVTSVVDSSDVDNVVLEQSFEVNVPVDSVWNAFTTKKGWESWAAAEAEIDFKINGGIRTIYDKKAELGDETTTTLHIINYVPQKMLTLQAEITKNFPEFMKEDEKDFFNSILFEEISATKTRVISYGIGYKLNDKYRSLMKFFIEGNEQFYLFLINYLETGKPTFNP